ncbi:MAG: hypothetical protein AAF567_00005, partial [Actinomycetota bacterium]
MHVSNLINGHEADGVALVCRDERRTWAELRGTVAQVCGRVSERTDPGDVVVVIGNTSIEFVEVMLG